MKTLLHYFCVALCDRYLSFHRSAFRSNVLTALSLSHLFPLNVIQHRFLELMKLLYGSHSIYLSRLYFFIFIYYHLLVKWYFASFVF